MSTLHRILDKSIAYREKAKRLIPSGTQTFSKCPSQFVQGVAPNYLERGMGSHVWDVDGNEYIDYAMALGSITLGHCYTKVTEEVLKQLKSGTIFTLPHTLEVEVAEFLCELIPCAEMVRFGKNGSDATSGAIRAARAYTGRDKIACCGYHGWQDWYIGTTTRSKGVPSAVKNLTIPFTYNDISTLENIFKTNQNQIACVIMEPVGVIPPVNNFLGRVKELTHKNGALLVFDELVTGFRLSVGGAQEYFGVIPDMACFGKGMANGYPISAVVGKRDVMEVFDEIFFSFTFGGEILSLAASLATSKEFKTNNVIDLLWSQGNKIKDGYNELARKYGVSELTECIGLAPRTVITFKDEKGKESLTMKSLFQQESLKRGVLFTGGHNVCFSHSDADIDKTLDVYNDVMGILVDAIEKGSVESMLEGPAVQPVFRKA